MRVGICVPNTHETLAEPATMVEVAERAERGGFDSVWVNDHVVVPRERVAAAGDRQHQYVDRAAQKIFEPLVLLSYLAARTERVALGTSVFVLALRNPVVAAKQVATLDVLSGGRAILGVGVGWMEAEFAALGVPWRERGRRTDVGLRVATALWRGDPSVDDVDLGPLALDLDGVVFNPLPDQQPRPPVWIGGRTEIAARRAARSGDAWHPSHLTLPELAAARSLLDGLCEQAGRSTGSVGLTTRRRVLPLVEPTEPPEERRTLQGTAAEIVADLTALAAAGVDHIVLELAATTAVELGEQVDWLATEVLAARADAREDADARVH